MWKTVKLGDVCDLQNGFAFKSSDYVDNSNTLNIRMSNIRPNGKFDESHNIKFLPDNYATKYAEYKLIEGDLIIAMTDMAGNPKILGMPTIVKNLDGRAFLLNQRVGKLHKFSDEIFVPYLCHFLSTLKNFFKNKGAGGLQINISKKDILSAKIPLPPLAEQQRIVAKLDAAFAEIDVAIEAAEKMLSNAETMRTKFVCQTFQTLDAVSSRLEDVTEILNGFAFKSGDFTTSAGTNVVKITNVGIREFIETDDTQLPIEFAKNYSKVSVKEGDVVFALTRTIINGGLKVARIPEAYHGALLNQRVAAVTASRDSIDTDFLYLYLSSDIVKDYVIEHVNTLMQPNLSIADLRNLEIPVATLKEQRLTAQRIEEISSRCTEIQDTAKRKIREYISLKSAILAQELQSEAA